MADAYDRVDTDSNGSAGSFLMGLLTGATIGAGLGLLFAPKVGSELRRQLGTRVGSLADAASSTYRQASDKAGDWASKAQESAGGWAAKASEVADAWADRGKVVYDEAREAAAQGASEAKRYVRDVRHRASTSGGSSESSERSGGEGPSSGSGPIPAAGLKDPGQS